MVIKETKIINGKEFTHTYSDTGMMIMRDGIRYAAAYDPIDTNRTYTETDIPINSREDPEMLKRLGVKRANNTITNWSGLRR